MAHWYSKPRPRQHNQHVMAYHRAKRQALGGS